MGNLDRAAKAMEKVDIPSRDAYDLPTSKKRFPDGAWYRMEVSGLERPNVLEALIDEMRKRNIPIHRLISVVMGATLLDKEELLDNPEGALSGIRYRGSDQLKYVVADIMCCIDIGFRGFLMKGYLECLIR